VEAPHSVRLLLGIRAQQQGFVRRKCLLTHIDLQTGQYGERRPCRHCTRLVFPYQPEAVGAQRIQPEVEEAVIAAQEIEIIRAPQAPKVATHSRRSNVSDIKEPERGGVLKQEAQHIPALQQLPVMEAFITEAAVMRVGDVEVPRLACDLEIMTGRYHKAKEI